MPHAYRVDTVHLSCGPDMITTPPMTKLGDSNAVHVEGHVSFVRRGITACLLITI